MERRQGRLPRPAARARPPAASRRSCSAWRTRTASAAAVTACRCALLERQAAALGLRLVTRATTWDGYEETYIAALHELREAGLQGGVFGDIDLEPHREWVERVCALAGMSCHLPLWLEPRLPLIEELFAGGVRATIVAVDAKRLEARFVGRELTRELVAELEALGIDACGEEGEYHTFVTEAPLFAAPVPLHVARHESRDGHWVLKFA